jgi:ABC-type sugar transport system ATPase subunit
MNLLPGPLSLPGASDLDPGWLVGLRPEAVRLDLPGGTKAFVDRVDVVGEDSYVYAKLPGDQPIVARVASARRPAAGDVVPVSVDWAAAHVFDSSGRRVSSP